MTAGRADLAGDLRRLGLAPGATVMVQASMRRIGAVEGGAAAVMGAIDDTIGPNGTVLMVLGALDEFDWVNDRPAHDRAELLQSAPVFDPLAAPADPDVGALAEWFRTRPGVVMNDHPDGRFAARGFHADLLVGDGPWHQYYGPGSALHHLVDLDGVVLRLGADDNTITLLHYAEHLAVLPVEKCSVTRHHRVLVDGLPSVVSVETLDDSDGICDYDLSAYDPADFPAHAIDDEDGVIDEFAVMLADYRATGAVLTGPVGAARGELIHARALVAFAVEWIQSHAIG